MKTALMILESVRTHSGVDSGDHRSWLGHSSPAATHQHLEADLAAKEAVLQHLDDPSPAPTRFKPDDQLLAFLQDL
jgi:integrase/recombinase XerD